MKVSKGEMRNEKNNSKEYRVYRNHVAVHADEIGIKNNGEIAYYLSDSQEEVSKKTFNQLLKKYVGKTKLTKAKFYKNNAGNRKKYLK